MSCATCHLPEKAFADGRGRGKGHEGKELTRNVPSLLNAGLYSTYFWDGRANSLEEQALGPIESPDEMNQDFDELERELNAVPGYVEQFQQVFGTKVTRDGVAKALAAFQRTLVSRSSPLDRYLAGDENALSPEAQEGLRLFVGDAGCVRCHKGPLLSDGKFYRIGVEYKLSTRTRDAARSRRRGMISTSSVRRRSEMWLSPPLTCTTAHGRRSSRSLSSTTAPSRRSAPRACRSTFSLCWTAATAKCRRSSRFSNP